MYTIASYRRAQNLFCFLSLLLSIRLQVSSSFCHICLFIEIAYILCSFYTCSLTCYLINNNSCDWLFIWLCEYSLLNGFFEHYMKFMHSQNNFSTDNRFFFMWWSLFRTFPTRCENPHVKNEFLNFSNFGAHNISNRLAFTVENRTILPKHVIGRFRVLFVERIILFEFVLKTAWW